MHNFARWDRDSDAIGPNEEVRQLRADIAQLAKIFPTMRIAESNHTVRPLKKASVAGISPKYFLRTLREILDAPKTWTWYPRIDHRDGFTVIHGEGYSGDRGAATAAADFGTNVVIGHIHSHAGIKFDSPPSGTRWAMNVGCLIDTSAPAFAYARHHRRAAVLGCGLVCDGVPQFIPFEGS
jgi:hypothetical protein